MSIKLIAVDMDGTFLSDTKQYNRERFLQQYAQMKEQATTRKKRRRVTPNTRKSTAPRPLLTCVQSWKKSSANRIPTKLFCLHRGGKNTNPREHRKLCDWGERAQPTKMQTEG
jgi:hypothetical protein